MILISRSALLLALCWDLRSTLTVLESPAPGSPSLLGLYLLFVFNKHSPMGEKKKLAARVITGETLTGIVWHGDLRLSDGTSDPYHPSELSLNFESANPDPRNAKRE